MKYRSFLQGLVIGVAVLGLSASPASAQDTYTWTGGFGTPNPTWTLDGNWVQINYPGDRNGGAPEGLPGDGAMFIGGGGNANPTAVGINFSATAIGGDLPVSGRLTLGAIGKTGGSGMTIGNSAVGAAAGEFNGILQLNSNTVGLSGFVTNSVLLNTSGQTLTIARNLVAANAANADMAVRINNTTNNIIELGGNSTIDIQTQLVMSDATARRITLQGAGTVRLRADNTQGYTAAFSQGTYVGLQGGFTMTGGGILRVGLDAAGAAMNGNLNLGIAPAAVTADYFQMANGTLRADSSFTLNANRGITLTTAGQAGTLHAEGAATTLTYDGVITGAGNLGKDGAGTVVLSQQQTYTGSTAVAAGLLQTTGVNGSLPAGTRVFLNGPAGGTSTAILDISNKAHTIGGLESTGATVGAGSQLLIGNNTLTIDTSVVSTDANAFKGIIDGTGAASLVKLGSGTTILAGASTYGNVGGANTTVSAGTLQLGNGTTNGTIDGGIVNNANVAFNPAAAGNTFSQVISGSGTVTKLGANVQTLSGANTYDGRTSVLGGTLAITADNNLGDAPGAATAGHLVLNGGTLQAGANFTLNTNRGIALGPTTGTGTGTISVGDGFTLTYGGVMDDQGGTGSFVKTGLGTLQLSAAQTYAGSTTVDQGNLLMTGTGPNQLPGTALVVGGGTNTALLNLNNNNQSVTDLTGNATGTIQLGSGTLTVNPTASPVFAGVIAGTGGLVKDGANTQILSGDNTFSGAITINAGTLQVGNGGATGKIAGTQAITNAGTLAFNQGADQTVSGVISGAGNLSKAGTGILTLSGTNTYTGTTTVTAGTLRAANASAFGVNSNFTVNGGTVHLNGNSVSIGSLAGTGGVVENNNATATSLTVNQGAAVTTYAGVIQNGAAAGALALTKNGTGNLTLSGANTFTGLIDINAGTLTVGAGATGVIAGTQNIENDGTLAFNQNVAQAVSGVISGTGALTKTGTGTLTLSGANTYGGATTINGGTVTLSGGADRLPATTTVTLANAANTNLNLNGQNQALVGLTGGGATGGNVQLGTGILTLNQTAANTYGGAISAGGSVIKNGNFDLILDGANSFTGGLTVNAGTVRVGTGGTTGALANNLPITFANNTALVVNKTNDLTLNGNITGAGSVTKDGAGGALILGGTNNYSGGTTVNAGTVRVASATALGTGNVTVGAATLSTTGIAASTAVTAGTLKINGSTIALGTNAHTLTFNGLDSSTTGLTVTGWSGSKFSSGTAGQIIFSGLGSDPNTTLQTWRDSVTFAGVFDTGPGAFFLDVGGGQFQLVPVPEPGTVLGIAAAGLAGLGVLRRRLRRKTEAAVAA